MADTQARHKSFICNNSLCKHYNYLKKNCGLRETITLDSTGCTCFEKGIHYYTNLVWSLLDNSNIITTEDLTKELRIALYIVMKLWNLSFVNARGMIVFARDGKTGLKHGEIVSEPINEEEFHFFVNLFSNNQEKEYFNNMFAKANPLKRENEDKEERDYNSFDQGWLSPNGKFFPANWGDHGAEAQKIVHRFYKNERDTIDDSGDFLIEKKNWVLIDDPGITGTPQIHTGFRVTKAQREFLYNNLMDWGFEWMAKGYMEDD